MRSWDAIETAQMTLDLVPEVLDPVDMVPALCEEFGMVAPYLMEVGNTQYIISLPAVRINNAIRHNLAPDRRNSVLPEASSIIITLTLPPLFNSPKTGTVPRPRFPLRLLPK